MLPKKFLEEYPEFKGSNLKLFYVRDDHSNPIGVILLDGNGYATWSLCNPVDQWDKIFGIRKALYKKMMSMDSLIKKIIYKIKDSGHRDVRTKYRSHMVYLYKKLEEIIDFRNRHDDKS
jgi:hypothetical protein